MRKPTLGKVRSMIAKSSGLPLASVTAEWTQRPRLLTYPTRHRGYMGKVIVRAPGYRTTEMIVTADTDGIMVR